MSEYNGWRNYETWCVSLWIDNDEGLYNDVSAVVRDVLDVETGDEARWAVAGTLKAYIDELPEVAEVRVRASFVSDLLGAALGEVDWDEIALHWIDALEEEAS